MSKRDNINIAGILAGIIFMTGVVLAIASILHYPAAKRQLAKDIKASAELEKLELKFSEPDIRIKPITGLDYSNLPPAEEVIANVLGRENIEKLEMSIDPLGNGYSINRMELTTKNIELKMLPNLIRSMEMQRPPIRVTACEITAAADHPGRGKLNLKMERIQR